MSTSPVRHPTRRQDAGATHAVLISAQILALNTALGAAGAEQTGALLQSLAQDLRQSARRDRSRLRGPAPRAAEAS